MDKDEMTTRQKGEKEKPGKESEIEKTESEGERGWTGGVVEERPEEEEISNRQLSSYAKSCRNLKIRTKLQTMDLATRKTGDFNESHFVGFLGERRLCVLRVTWICMLMKLCTPFLLAYFTTWQSVSFVCLFFGCACGMRKFPG